MKPLDYSRLEAASADALGRVRQVFSAIGFDYETLCKIMGKQVVRYVRLFADDKDYLLHQVFDRAGPLRTALSLFLIGGTCDAKEVETIFGGPLVAHLVDLDILRRDDDGVFSSACITPVGGARIDGSPVAGWYLNDGEKFGADPGHVFPFGSEQPYLIRAATLVLESGVPRPRSILDLCTGSGVLGLALSERSSEICGIDINPRAIAFARFNARLNGRDNAAFVMGSAAEGWPETRRFDCIVANPPYNAHIGGRTDGGEGRAPTLHAGDFGDALTRPIIATLADRLTDRGVAFVVSTWLMQDGRLTFPEIRRLLEDGTVILLHTPVAAAVSWEGLRALFWTEPIRRHPPGFLRRRIEEAGYFNQVTFGVLCYLKGRGQRGFHMVENIQIDRRLISAAAESALVRLAA